MSSPSFTAAQFQDLLRRTVWVPLLGALIMAFILLWQIYTLRQAMLWVDHSDRVIAQTNLVERLMIDAETGVRGFLLNREKLFLEPYDGAVEKVTPAYQALLTLVSDNPSQTGLAERMKNLSGQWFQLARSNMDGSDMKPLNHVGKKVMDHIRQEFDQFVENEQALRMDRSRNVEFNTLLVFLMCAGLMIIFGAFVSLRTHRAFVSLSNSHGSIIQDLQSRAQELQTSRKWFATTLRSIGDAVIAVDKTARVVFLNPVAEKLTGWKMEEAHHQPMADVFNIVNERTRNAAINPVDRVLREGIIVGLANHTVLIGKDKVEYPIEDSAAPIKSEDGEIEGVVLVFRDVTDRHETERELEISIKTLKTLNDVGTSIAAELKLEELVQRVTDAATQATSAKFGAFFYNVTNEKGEAYALYAVSGAPKEAFSKFPMPRNTAVFAPTFAGQGVVRSDDITKDPRYGHNSPHAGLPKGHLPVVSYLAVPVISRSGEVLGGIFFGHPETAKFTAGHEEIVKGLASQASVAIDNARLFKNAQDAVRLRDQFLSIASHELKTPLTSLRLQLQLGRRGIGQANELIVPAERLAHTLDLCLGQTKRLVTLVDDLLDVSRIQSGRLAYQFDKVDLQEIVKDAHDRFADQFSVAGSRLELDVEPGIIAWCDRFRIDQVVANLISNALKYGDGKPVKLALRLIDGEAEISVADRGTGIDPQKQNLIFELYERAIGSANISGLGLGLYISKQIVSAHHGTIGVESEPGRGARFYVRLPLKAQSKKEMGELA